MNTAKQLIELMDQASARVTLLETTDMAELLAFGDIVERLNALAVECSETDGLFKPFHQISADAAALVQRLTAAPEQASAAQIDLLTSAVMEMQQLLKQAVTASPVSEPAANDPTAVPFSEEDIPLIQDFIAESREHIESAEKALLELEKDPTNSEVLNQIFRSFHTIKGMAGFLNLSDVNMLAHAAENLLDLARKGELLLVDANSDAVFASIDMLKEMLGRLEESIGNGKGMQRPVGLDAQLEFLRTCADLSASSAAGKTSAIPAKTEQKPDPKPSGRLQESVNATSTATAQAVEKIKVDMARLDELINMTGELAIAQLMISEEVKKAVHADSDLFRKVALQDKIVRELQELSMSMRMVPIQGAFQKMSRLVRDLSKKAGKNIQFITTGEETELDRNIVDKITDPLVHMMRNSVDHGIETPDERTRKGKSACGQIHLNAYHQAGGIVIEIQDDGRGLNKDKLLKKAVEKGLIAEHQELGEDETFRLIFHAGFSTAEKVSDVSGRGVGMDVVRKNIESLGGKVDIRSIPDQGTTFIVRLPLTLAVIDGQIVTVGDQRYIIPITSIVGSLRPATDQVFTVQGKAEVAMIRGEMIRLVRMGRLFEVANAVENPCDGLMVVVEEGGRKCALFVDDLVGQQQVVIKNLSSLGKIKGISGGAIMGDGRISLILDIPGLIDLSLSSQHGRR